MCVPRLILNFIAIIPEYKKEKSLIKVFPNGASGAELGSGAATHAGRLHQSGDSWQQGGPVRREEGRVGGGRNVSYQYYQLRIPLGPLNTIKYPLNIPFRPLITIVV